MNSDLACILAAEPVADSLRVTAGAGSVEILAAEATPAGAPAKLPRLLMRVYTGGIIMQQIVFASGRFYSGPVVADLEGMKLPGGMSPALIDHDDGKILGHGKASIAAGVLSLEGLVSGTGPAAKEFLDNSRNGFPYQASMRARILSAEDVEPGVEVQVNGKTFTGPLLVARETEFTEASAVPLGADQDTAARVAASLKEQAMDPKFKAWLIAKGENPEALSAAQLASRKATWEAEVQAAAAPPAPVPVPVPVPAPAAGAPAADLVAARQEGARLERERVTQIRASAQGLDVGADVVEAAVAGNDTLEAAERRFLAAMRQRSPSAGSPAIVSARQINAQVLEAGMILAFQRVTGLSDDAVVRHYGEQTVNAAARFRRQGFCEILEAAARMEGVTLPNTGRRSSEWIRAAFSTANVSGILGNVANKTLLAAYQAVPSAARIVAKQGSVSDFKTVSRYRLTGTGAFEKVGPSGELKHGTLNEQSFNQKADTWGRYIMITRQDVINDDLGAFLDLAAMLGRDGANALELAFFTLLLSNPSNFFAASPSGRKANYASGAGTALGTAGLAAAVALFDAQEDAQNMPVNAVPKFLLVPPALRMTAEQLYVSTNLSSEVLGLASTSSGSRQQVPNANVHAGKYAPVVSPFLSNSRLTGYSAAAWYLFADPNVLPAAEIAGLNGNLEPVIEAAEPPADKLGMGFRAYSDFGVAMQDPRGAVKMAGT